MQTHHETAPAATQSTRELARFVAGLGYRDLPPAVVSRIKFSLLDTIGCGVHGSTTPWGRIVTEHAAETAGSSPIWVDGRASGTAMAAMANGSMVHSFELDDLHAPSRSHPGGVTIPVAMALAHDLGGLDGKSFIAAVAVGYEMTTRVGLCQGVSSFNRGWHPTGTAGVIGAAATSAKALKLSAEETLHCLGIAGTMPAGLMAAQYGAMVKRLFAGHAAFVGVTAAKLAKRGFTGIPDLFEAPFGGYPKALSDEVDLDVLTKDLGASFVTASVGYKFYPCVGASHTSLDALDSIMTENALTADQIAFVTVTTSDYQKVHAGWPYEPRTIMAAQMNMQFCLATLMLRRRVFVDEFTEASIRDPEILRWISRIQVDVDPKQGPTDRTARVEVRLNDGRILSAERKHAIGHPAGPPIEAKLAAKFDMLAGRVLAPQALAAVKELVADLENLSDVRVIERWLCPPIAAPHAAGSPKREWPNPKHCTQANDEAPQQLEGSNP